MDRALLAAVVVALVLVGSPEAAAKPGVKATKRAKGKASSPVAAELEIYAEQDLEDEADPVDPEASAKLSWTVLKPVSLFAKGGYAQTAGVLDPELGVAAKHKASKRLELKGSAAYLPPLSEKSLAKKRTATFKMKAGPKYKIGRFSAAALGVYTAYQYEPQDDAAASPAAATSLVQDGDAAAPEKPAKPAKPVDLAKAGAETALGVSLTKSFGLTSELNAYRIGASDGTVAYETKAKLGLVYEIGVVELSGGMKASGKEPAMAAPTTPGVFAGIVASLD